MYGNTRNSRIKQRQAPPEAGTARAAAPNRASQTRHPLPTGSVTHYVGICWVVQGQHSSSRAKKTSVLQVYHQTQCSNEHTQNRPLASKRNPNVSGNQSIHLSCKRERRSERPRSPASKLADTSVKSGRPEGSTDQGRALLPVLTSGWELDLRKLNHTRCVRLGQLRSQWFQEEESRQLRRKCNECVP